MSLEYVTVTMIGAMSGICLIAISFILTNRPRLPSYGPLTNLLLSILILVAPSWLAVVRPTYFVVSVGLSLVAFMSLGPLLWLYVDSLTSRIEWHFSLKKLTHFIPAALSLLALLGVFTAPYEDVESMVLLSQVPENGLLKPLVIIVWLLLVLWVPQSIYYLVVTGVRLVRHHKRLKGFFSNTECRELNWLSWLFALVAALWGLLVVNFFVDTVFNASLVVKELLILIALLSVWILTLWGLRQKPAFDGQYLHNAPATEESETQSKKYSRSSLSKDRASEIVALIKKAIVCEELFLDSDLTLSDLAESIDTSSHLVSQVLNQHMGTTFFDYVNENRIEAAKVLLAQTTKSALDICYEVGFNARSSFYKAFKQITNTTPAQYRKMRLADALGDE